MWASFLVGRFGLLRRRLELLGYGALWELDVVFVDQDRPFYIYRSDGSRGFSDAAEGMISCREGLSVDSEILFGHGSLQIEISSFHSAPDV